ncbi:hypothetical protein BCR35DRAFT_306761 [Leucosporidium creatinivorum]|uniref:Uncharacterized protein n=1 Tax=Leucosporidium creatinivorum TaxID=106004 RepID=A0A1Y2ESP4_9BASI|nr:hypothetical protein BCR35DRAFT_306761 [Leucosporidium creatinivorum]
MAATLWTIIKLIVTIALLGGFLFAVMLAVRAFNSAVASTKESLAGRGVNISSSGVAVKTEKRAKTAEESADAARSGLMKAWKSSSFKVPYLLSKGSNLGGSRHDKDKEEWESKYGPKKHKNHVD